MIAFLVWPCVSWESRVRLLLTAQLVEHAATQHAVPRHAVMECVTLWLNRTWIVERLVLCRLPTAVLAPLVQWDSHVSLETIVHPTIVSTESALLLLLAQMASRMDQKLVSMAVDLHANLVLHLNRALQTEIATLPFVTLCRSSVILPLVSMVVATEVSQTQTVVA